MEISVEEALELVNNEVRFFRDFCSDDFMTEKKPFSRAIEAFNVFSRINISGKRLDKLVISHLKSDSKSFKSLYLTDHIPATLLGLELVEFVSYFEQMTFGIKESETCRLVEKLKYFDGRQRISREAQKRNAEKAQRLTQDFLFRAILVKLVNKMIRFVKLVDFDPHYLFLTIRKVWSRSVKEGIKEFSELLVMIIRANEVHTTFSGQLIRRESEGCTLIEFLHRQFQRENHTDIAFKTAVMKTSGSFHKRGCKECQTLKADMDKILHLGQGVQIKLRQMAWLEEKHSSQEDDILCRALHIVDEEPVLGTILDRLEKLSEIEVSIVDCRYILMHLEFAFNGRAKQITAAMLPIMPTYFTS